MLNKDCEANTNTNTQRVCIIKNSEGNYLIATEHAFKAAQAGQSKQSLTAEHAFVSGLAAAMAAAYRLSGRG